MLDLALLDQLPDRSGHVLDRDGRIDAVLVEEVDVVGAEPTQRPLDGALDRVGATVEPASRRVTGEIEAELACDHDLIAQRFECLADELFVRVRAIDLGGVEEGDTLLDRVADQPDPFLLGREGWEGLAEAHAAKADLRDLKTLAECACVHVIPPSSGAASAARA